ncbi:MAG: Lrp/AsnC family transcriptional regulator [Pseudomonadota bacterium]
MLDKTDRALLRALQYNATATAQELSSTLHLSASQISRRKARLEAEGYIAGYGARLSADQLGLAVQAFVQVSMADHTPEHARQFQALAERRPEVTSLWTLTGDADYLARVWCPSLADLNHLVHEVFLPHGSVARVRTQIVMSQIKADAGLPVEND